MLNINLEGFRDYAQHFQFIFSCSSKIHAQHKFFHNSCVPEILAQCNLNTYVLQSLSLNTYIQILMCSRYPCSTQNISSIMCFRVHAQHKQALYISSIIGLRPIYKTNHQVHMQWGIRPNI